MASKVIEVEKYVSEKIATGEKADIRHLHKRFTFY